MAWDSSERARELPPDWSRRRLRVLRRAEWTCEATRSDTGRRCWSPATDVDHIIRGRDHHLENLQALCGWHHLLKTAVEAATGRVIARRSRYPHLRHRQPPGARSPVDGVASHEGETP